MFDSFLDEDSSFFVNLKKLQSCNIPEFKDAYKKVNERFQNIGLLLKNATPGSKLYRAAFAQFNFPEVDEINLGFSSGKHGAGFGEQLRKQIIKDAYEIIQSGSEQPEIFHLVSLFEENVGPDRLSDMTARIIYENIVMYTRRVMTELDVNEEAYASYRFKNGLVMNPYKNHPILLLPEELLHELPIAKCWDDIDRVCSENAAIRAEINELVSDEWSKMSSSAKKAYMKDEIFKNPERLGRVISAYRNAEAGEFNKYRNADYVAWYLSDTYKLKETKSDTSFDAALEILEAFREWVEFHRGASVIQGESGKPTEKLVQKLIHGVAQLYCTKFNWDFSPETDSGRGPVDFKISRGSEDKTVIEVKLSSNKDCVHGLEVQIEEYAKAENTNKKIFVFVDTGSHSERINDLKQKSREMKGKGLNPATIVSVNAIPKISASKYDIKK